MSDNIFIEEDWQRAYEMDKLYQREREIQMMNDYWEWFFKHEEERLPATINVVVPKGEENEIKHIS